MPKSVVGYAEPAGSKLKKGNGFWKPNFGVGPNIWLEQLGHKQLAPFLPGIYTLSLSSSEVKYHD